MVCLGTISRCWLAESIRQRQAYLFPITLTWHQLIHTIICGRNTNAAADQEAVSLTFRFICMTRPRFENTTRSRGKCSFAEPTRRSIPYINPQQMQLPWPGVSYHRFKNICTYDVNATDNCYFGENTFNLLIYMSVN